MSGTSNEIKMRPDEKLESESIEGEKNFQSDQNHPVDENNLSTSDLHDFFEQRYLDLYEKTPCLLRSVTLDGIIFACSEFYAKKLGYEKNEVIGKSIFEHTAEKSIKKLIDEIKCWKVTGQISNVEIWMKRKDGSIFPTLLNGSSLFDKNKKLIGRTAVLVDMTEIHKAKEEIEEHKIHRLSTIGELSARIAHDLRNPLSVINNTLEVIKIQNPDFEKANQEKFDRIERAVKRMTHQVEEVMEYVVPCPLDLQNTSLLGIVKSAVLNVKTNKTEVTLPQNDLSVICDAEKLEIVFTNLLLNATQAMNNRGKISLRIKEGMVNNGQNRDFATIEIEDTGPGIPKSLMPKIFDPLFTTKQVGTGLGLASCKNIVEKHGGHIDIKTEVGHGTTFIVNIPK